MSSQQEPKKNSLWSKMKGFGNSALDATKKAADSTQRAAKRAKIKTEISLLLSKLRKEKEKFGVKVYDHIVKGDETAWQNVLAETKIKIDSITMQIENKRRDVLQLSDGRKSVGEKPKAQTQNPVVEPKAFEI